MIHVDRLTRKYDQFEAVSELTFKINPGEILGLIGPNGAGKTTTLRVLSGIIPPSSGSVTLNGHDVVSDAIAARRITGYVPDDPKLFETLTVREHLDFMAAMYEVDDYMELATSLLTNFELVGKLDVPVQNLSLGMRQKLAICCAYLTSPQIIIFDEPLTGLDPKGIQVIQNSIKQCAENGAAVIISSHLLSLVEKICTHLLILDDGKKLLHDSMENILKHVDSEGLEESLETVFFRITREQENPV